MMTAVRPQTSGMSPEEVRQRSMMMMKHMGPMPAVTTGGLRDSGMESGSSPEMAMQTSPPMSRTTQYRKVMKPLLERKRRARINQCLDELKDIMVSALQAEGESITKLEKADVLELTVRHLRKLKQQNALGLTPQATYAGRFKAGYSHCAQEVSKFMTSEKAAGVDIHVSTRLLSHLGSCIQTLENLPPSSLSTPLMISAPPPPPASASSSPSPMVPAGVPLPGPSQALLRYALFPAMMKQSADLSLIKHHHHQQQASALSPSVSPSDAAKNFEASIKRSISACGIDDKAWRPW